MTSTSLPRQDRWTNPLPPFEQVRQHWERSKWFRRALIIATLYAALRIVLQLILIAGVFAPDQDASLSLPDDLRIYLEASEDLRQQTDLYPSLPLERMEFYQYAPSFALAFTPFLWLPTGLTVLLHTILHVAIYALLYISWGRIFRRFNLQSGLNMLARLLPLWLVFASFWSDLGFLNVYILMALLATLLIEAVLSENLATSVLWAVIILQIKPQWAFMLAVPLVLGNRAFFVKLIAVTIAAYAVVTVVTMLIAGSSYALTQYGEYGRLLFGIGSNYPWRTPDMPFLGYNHSIAQTVIYLAGNTPEAFRLATIIKVILLLPLALLSFRSILSPRGAKNRRVQLDWAFAFYAAAFIWLDVVWELSLGIAVFTYLLATTQNRRLQTLLRVVFLPYALVDVIQVMSYIIFGDAVVVPGPYILMDPSIYLPLTMVVTVIFYGVVVGRLFAIPAAELSDPVELH